MATLYRAGLERVKHERLGPKALAGAQAGAEVLKAKLSGGGHGVQYPGLPNRSSTEGEYPAEQSGALRDAVDAQEDGPGRAVFGLINNPPPYTAALHFQPPDEGGRPVMNDALADRDVRKAVWEGMKR